MHRELITQRQFLIAGLITTSLLSSSPYLAACSIDLRSGHSISRAALATQERCIGSLPGGWMGMSLSSITADILPITSEFYLFASSPARSKVSSCLDYSVIWGFWALSSMAGCYWWSGEGLNAVPFRERMRGELFSRWEFF